MVTIYGYNSGYNNFSWEDFLNDNPILNGVFKDLIGAVAPVYGTTTSVVDLIESIRNIKSDDDGGFNYLKSVIAFIPDIGNTLAGYCESAAKFLSEIKVEAERRISSYMYSGYGAYR